MITADAFAVEHDVVFAVSPDARQLAAQRVSREASGADQGQAPIGPVLVVGRRGVGRSCRLVNFRFVLSRRSPLFAAVLPLRGERVVFEIGSSESGGDESFRYGLEDLR